VIDLILPTYNFSLFYAEKLVADVPDERMAAQPVAGRVMNHAAFTLGHLAWANDNGLALLGRQPTLADWKGRMGIGATPSDDRSLYPSKAVLLDALKDAHGRLATAVREASPEALAQPGPEQMRRMFPTVGAMFVGLMTSHEGSHLGQLSAWRRAMGFPSVF